MDPLTLSLLMSGGGALLGGLGGLFGGDDSGEDPAQFLNQIPGIGKQYYEPYIQRGNEAQGRANNQYNRMAENPTDFINQIISSYKPSEGYKFREKNALNAARNSAAAGGFSGTHNDQMGQAELVNGLMGNDMQQWLQNILGAQGTGLQGLENESNRGFQSSGNLADYLGSALGQRAGLAHNRQQQGQQNSREMMAGLGQLLGAAGGLAGGFGGGSNPAGMVGGGSNFRSPGGGGFPFKNTTPSIYGNSSVFGGFK